MQISKKHIFGGLIAYCDGELEPNDDFWLTKEY